MEDIEFERFKMATDMIPEGVDIELAAQRTALVEGWRHGEATAEATFADLLDLYWVTQPHTDDQTRVYLMQSSYQFPAEAGIASEVASVIYRQSLKGR